MSSVTCWPERSHRPLGTHSVNVHKKILIGSLWAVAMRWGTRLIGLLSVIVLARILRPEDFGILAMATLLIGLLENFAELGVAMMVIREANVSRVDLDTGWTIQIIQGQALAAVVALLAEPAAAYFHEPRVTAVVYLCAISMSLGSFSNIGVVLIRKDLDFAKDFIYQIIVKLSGVVVTIGLAFWLRNYWALALAQPVSALTNLATSYRMHPYRPRFSLKSYRRFLSFSANVVLSNLARFLSNKADMFLVGRIGTSAQMGVYNVASELSSMPSRELTVSVGRALFPTLANVKSTTGDFLAIFLQVIGSVAALCLPIGLGIWAVADDLVRVVLGEQWHDAGRLMGFLAIYGTLASLIDIMIGHVLIVTGHERRQTMALWIRVVLLVVCALAGTWWSIEGIAVGATVSSVLVFAVAVWILKETLQCRLGDFAAIFWRPTVASLLMAMIVHYGTLGMAVPVLARLIFSVALGVVCYVGILAMLWVLAGKPPGVEMSIMNAFFGRPSTKSS